VTDIASYDSNAEAGNVSTFKNSSGEFSYNIGQETLENTFDGQEDSTGVSTTENVRIYKESLTNQQNFTISNDTSDYNRVFNVDTSDESASALSAEYYSQTGDYVNMQIDRWFTAKFTDEEPVIVNSNQTKSWE